MRGARARCSSTVRVQTKVCRVCGLHLGGATCLEGEQGKPRSEWGNEFTVYPILAIPAQTANTTLCRNVVTFN